MLCRFLVFCWLVYGVCLFVGVLVCGAFLVLFVDFYFCSVRRSAGDRAVPRSWSAAARVVSPPPPRGLWPYDHGYVRKGYTPPPPPPPPLASPPLPPVRPPSTQPTPTPTPTPKTRTPTPTPTPTPPIPTRARRSQVLPQKLGGYRRQKQRGRQQRLRRSRCQTRTRRWVRFRSGCRRCFGCVSSLARVSQQLLLRFSLPRLA